MKKADTWLDDVLLPIVYYRLSLPIYYSYFKSKMLLRKTSNNWIAEHPAQVPISESTAYTLCYGTSDAYTGQWQTFSVYAKNSLTIMDVAFHANPRQKPYAAFAYDFSSKAVGAGICHLEDLVLPDYAVAEIRDCILNRRDDEELSLGRATILHPRESVEEVLIERDLASSV